MRHTSPSLRSRVRLRAVLGPLLVPLLGVAYVAAAAPAHAADGSIDFVDDRGETIQVIYSLTELAPGFEPDLGSLRVTFDGEPVEAEAEPASGSPDTVRRTTVLAFDVSNSMRQNGKFDEAKAAAEAFLDNVPDDVSVGVVTFAGDVTEAQAPTTDRDRLREVVDGLTLSNGTKLYDGVREAVAAAGTDGSRSVLVLSDGKDAGSSASLEEATRAVADADVVVDVVALAQTEQETARLQRLANAGNGQVLGADDPAALREVFQTQAENLAQQVLVRFTPPSDLAGAEGTLAVSLDVDGLPVTDEAFVRVSETLEEAGGGEGPTPLQPAESGIEVPRGVMFAGLGAAAVSVGLLLYLAVGTAGRSGRDDQVAASIEAYTRKGARRLAQAQQAQSQSVTQQAVAVAESVLEGNAGIESALSARLEAAGLQLKAAEWLLVHAGVALGLGLLGLLVGGGSVLPMLLGLLFGAAAPWTYLSLRKGRRLKAFKAQLADVLQLMSGSLSAGLSLAQSVDTVVREGADPIAGEFRRALVESRLGVNIEESLMGIAERMQSKDFEWVVMAIRIQREVGGNLAELLNKVAETIREREYLERQVLSLSAEGRLSVWILGGLPPGFMAYLLLANPTYLQPMFGSALGWAMLIVMGILLTAGILWMKRLVKVTV